MTMAQTLEVVHCLMNNVKVVMDGTQGLLGWLWSFNSGVFWLDGKASMDGIWKALGELFLCTEIGVAEADYDGRYDAADCGRYKQDETFVIHRFCHCGLVSLN
jgi:hypothetical protein